jgi:sugar phosphate isomerase/epimerase
MRLGYNTNGFAHHNLLDAIAILAELGYSDIAITLDHGCLNPYADDLAAQINRVAKELQRHGMRASIETGARFLLDPRRKHWPPLTIDPELAQRRVDFIQRACAIAADLNAEIVSIWSGVLPVEVNRQDGEQNLIKNLERALATAEMYKVTIGFEPEPGMMIDLVESFRPIARHFSGAPLGLTLDIGHLHCQAEDPIAERIRDWQDSLVHVHLEDMRQGVHDHLMFGEGEIDFLPVMQALLDIRYRGSVCVELSRHSHDAVQVASRSLAFLRKVLSACVVRDSNTGAN